MRFAVVGENILNLLVHVDAVLLAGARYDVDAAEGLDGALEQLVGLQTDDQLLFFVDVAGFVRSDGRNGLVVQRTDAVVGALLFEGGYALEENYGWYRSNGAHDMDGFVIVRPGTSDPWNGFEVDRSTALRFALGPELESRGSWGMYVFMLVCTVFAALDAAFPMTMFYLQHCCDVRDPEPSDFYLACQKAGWVVFPLLLLGGYCYALRVIP